VAFNLDAPWGYLHQQEYDSFQEKERQTSASTLVESKTKLDVGCELDN